MGIQINMDFRGVPPEDLFSEMTCRLDSASFLMASGSMNPEERDSSGLSNLTKLKIIESMFLQEAQRLYPDIPF